MKKLVVWIFLFALVQMASAQPRDNSYNSHGYVQIGAGGCTVGVDHWISGRCGGAFNLVGGGEGFVYKGLAIGGEGGYGWIHDDFDDGVGMWSVNPAYHFKGRGRSRTLAPFVTAGYTMLFREGHINGFNAGGGATWWAGNHVGLRFEGRLYHFDAGPLGAHVYMFRIGPSFR